MRLFFLLALVLGLSACTKQEAKDKLCDAGKTVATVLAAQAAVELECTNTAAIKASIEKKLIDLKVCEAKADSVVGDILCGPVIEGLFIGAIEQLPAEWGCTGGPLAAEAKAKLIAACAKAF